MTYIDLLKNANIFDFGRQDFLQKLKELEPEEPEDLFLIFQQLSSRQTIISWNYIFAKLLLISPWDRKKKNFILNLLSMAEFSNISNDVTESLFDLGEKRNVEALWLRNILELDDHLKLLPHLDSGLWKEETSSVLEDWKNNIYYKSAEELDNFLISLTHINKLEKHISKEVLKKYVIEFIISVREILRTKCNTQAPNSFTNEECRRLSKSLFFLCKVSFEEELIDKGELLRTAIDLELEGFVLLNLYQSNVSLTLDETWSLFVYLFDYERIKYNSMITRLVQVFFNALYSTFYKTEEPDLEMYFEIYKALIKQQLLSLTDIPQQLLEDLNSKDKEYCNRIISEWLQEDIDPSYTYIPQIISKCFSKSFDEALNYVYSLSDVTDDFSFLKILEEILTTYQSSFKNSTKYNELDEQIKSLFKNYKLNYNRVKNKSRERDLPEMPLAVSNLLTNLKGIDEQVVIANLAKYKSLNQKWQDLVKGLLQNDEQDHQFLKMLNSDSPYLERLNFFANEIPDIFNKREINKAFKVNGERLFDAFSELEIAYFFQDVFNIDESKRELEESLFTGSKKFDFKLKFPQQTIWIEVKRYYDLDESRIYREVRNIERSEFENNLWDKFQDKLPELTEDNVSKIEDPVIFAIDIGDSSITDLDIKNYLLGTSVTLVEMIKAGKYEFKQQYREEDSMSDRSPLTKIISGFLLFRLGKNESNEDELQTRFYENPSAKNKILSTIIEKLNLIK